MKDQTITETGIELPADALRVRSAVGVVIVFVRGPCTPVAVRIERRQVVGRVDEVDVTIDDRAVSREHAELEPTPGGVLVTDLGSHNGTFVQGERVTEPKRFAPAGSVIRLAKTLMVVVDDVVPTERLQPNRYPSLVGGASLEPVRRFIDTMARTGTPVLLEGETGTGKEVVARTLHDASGRPGSFVAVNSAALAPELVESELFGHARGSFSGSTSARSGLFRSAHRGTLLLDEIGELSLAIQAKLLRVLETGEVRGVGEDAPTKVDVRVVAATNRSLDAMLQTNEFRADLLYRVGAARISLPPLRARVEDVPALAGHFLDGAPLSFSVGAMELLMQHEWPGNARELRNVVATAAAEARRQEREAILPEDLRLAAPPSSTDEAHLKTRIEQVLSQTGGNVTQAARDLGMARSVLYEALRRLGISPGAFRRR